MIYNIFFTNVTNGIREVDRWSELRREIPGERYTTYDLLARVIKETENNSFVFITTKGQDAAFQEFLDKYELNSLIVFQTPQYITNPVHDYSGRVLKITVIQTAEHFINDLFDEAEDMFNNEEGEVEDEALHT